MSPCLKQFVLLVSLQTGRRRRPRRDESSCCWMNWSYWSTNETRWSGTWTPRRNSKLSTVLQHTTSHSLKHKCEEIQRSTWVSDSLWWVSVTVAAAYLYISRGPSETADLAKTHCWACCASSRLQSSCTAAAAHLRGRDPFQIGGAVRQQGARQVKGRSSGPGTRPLYRWHCGG